MRTSSQIKIGGLLVAILALAAFAALAFSHSQAGSSVAGGVGAMEIDCDTGQAGVQSDCVHALGSTFSIQVLVTDPPAGGYFGFQSKVRWTEGIVNYLPAAVEGDEALWPNCTIPARIDNMPLDPSVLFGCVPLPALQTGSTFTGAVLQLEFNCKNVDPADLTPPGSNPESTLTLVPGPGDNQNGSNFLDDIGTQLDPALTDATVKCADVPEGPTPTPTEGGPTSTPGGPTETPGEGTVVGDIILPVTGGGFTSTDGGVSSGVWALIAALIAAGAAGLAVFGWRHARIQ